MDYIIVHPKVIVNSLGLFFGVVGALLVWKFGLPASIDRTGAIRIVTGQKDPLEIQRARKYDCRSTVGIWLIIFSFLIQLASNFL